MASRATALLLLAAVAAGCGHARGVQSAAPATFVSVAPPASRDPGVGPAHVVFLGRRRGVIATTGGAGYLQKVGYQLPVEAARIQVTRDGGRTWRTVWHERGSTFRSLAFSGRVGVAQGTRLDVRDFRRHRMAGYPHRRPLVLLTRDRGEHWRRLVVPRAAGLATVQPLTPRVLVALTNPLLRTADGGRTWRLLALPRTAGPIRFASPELGFAGAPGSDCPTAWQLFRTADGGRSWTPAPGTCGPPFTDIDVAPDGTVVTAQSVPTFADAGLRTVVRRSLDGGRTWRTLVDRGDWPNVATVAFADARRGWAVSDEYDQGFHAQAVHVTTDGGRTWRRRSFPLLPVGFDGARAWAADSLGAGLWRTNDWGRSWRVSARPEQLEPKELTAATRSLLVVVTLAGALASRDGGHTWEARTPLGKRAAARLEGKPAFLVPARDYGAAAAYLTPDGGRTLRRLAPRRSWPDTGDVAFVNARHGLIASGQGEFGPDGRVPVYATDDGARSWRAVPVPRGVERDREVTLGPGIVVIRRPPLLYLSNDAGRHWVSTRVRDDFWDCGSAGSGKRLWVLCSLSVNAGPSILLRSEDGGRSWLRRTLPVQLDVHLAVVGAREAWAIAKNTNGGLPRRRPDGALWHTTDAGRTWHEVWPHLDAPAHVFELHRGGRLG